MRQQKGFIAIVFLVLLSLCATSNVNASADVGSQLPEISLPEAVPDGANTSLNKMLEGKVGVIVYMQTSCAVCRRELKSLNELNAKMSFKMVAISVDADNPARVAKYKEHFGFEFPFLQDSNFETPGLFGFSYTPALVLVDKDGKIAKLKGGFRPGDEVEIEKAISELLGK